MSALVTSSDYRHAARPARRCGFARLQFDPAVQQRNVRNRQPLIREHDSDEPFQRMGQGAVPLSQFLLEPVTQSIDLRQTFQRINAPRVHAILDKQKLARYIAELKLRAQPLQPCPVAGRVPVARAALDLSGRSRKAEARMLGEQLTYDRGPAQSQQRQEIFAARLCAIRAIQGSSRRQFHEISIAVIDEALEDVEERPRITP